MNNDDIELKVSIVENGFVVCEKIITNENTSYKTWAFESAKPLSEFVLKWAAEQGRIIEV